MTTPLADQLRPKTLEGFVGQEHLVGKNGPIRKMLENGKVTSMILWGPPGCGKTTLAKLIANYVNADFIAFSAVTSGVKEVREIIQKAKDRKQMFKQDTVLFIDEIHRFNKAQQDAFLPHVEDGTIVLIGATTENPGFEVNAPLISRSQVYVLYSLSNEELEKIFQRASKLYPKHKWDSTSIKHLIKAANGDA
ncbi:AAA family ATPase, partial [Candidatus Roizmanbacteria bacterium]|nr:AAA family ATPase [Candidatus Roizmanbacteria bacterium]